MPGPGAGLLVRVVAAATGVSGCSNQAFGQCGGNGFAGSTCCPAGSKCTVETEWWSACMPRTAVTKGRALDNFDYISWVHIPKCGTSFGNTLVHAANPSLPPTARMPTCDKHALHHDASVDKKPKYGLFHPYQPHRCKGATDVFFQLYPHKKWFRHRFACGKDMASGTCDAGRHMPLTGKLFAAHKGHFQGLFRDPAGLIPSSYLRAARGAGRIEPPSNDLDFNTAEGKATLLKYASTKGKGLQVRFLVGSMDHGCRLKPSACPPFRLSTKVLNQALARLDGFSFVGIVDEWAYSICLYHRMMMNDRECLEIEFANNRETEIGDTHLGKALIQEAGLADDEYDGVLYAKAKQIFSDNMAQYNVNDETCAAIRCTANSWIGKKKKEKPQIRSWIGSPHSNGLPPPAPPVPPPPPSPPPSLPPPPPPSLPPPPPPASTQVAQSAGTQVLSPPQPPQPQPPLSRPSPLPPAPALAEDSVEPPAEGAGEVSPHVSPTPTAPAGPVSAVGYSVLLLGFVFLLLGWILLRKARTEGVSHRATPLRAAKT